MNHTIVPKITFITYSLGCRTNQAELENISLQLKAYGLQTTDYRLQQSCPNMVLINTCMVTGKAERETRKAIRHFRKLYPQAKIIVLGCAVTAKTKFKINLPEADLLISNEEKDRAIHRIATYIKKMKRYTRVRGRGLKCNVKKTDYEESGRKFIKIQDGCNNCCSFCITTYLRGEPRSEKPEKIINLINELTNSKIKELILTGINIGLYGNDLKPQMNIWGLVSRILKETKIERLTLSTVYPEMLSVLGSDPVEGRTLMECVGSGRVTKCFHLALQSGSPSVLQRMNRPTDLNKLLTAINLIRKTQPDFTFRADIITGFPGETEEEHQATLEFLKEAQISFAHVFPYSTRIGTVAYEMIQKKKWQEVSPEIKKLRKGEIEKVVNYNQSNQAKKFVGKKYRALIIRELDGKLEGISDNGWTIIMQNSPPKADQSLAEKCKTPSFAKYQMVPGFGRTQQSQIQDLKRKTNLKGTMIKVKITGYEKGQLLGEILSLPI